MEQRFEIGEKLPDWDLSPLFEEINLPKKEDYLGKPFVILFFSLHCPGCLGRAIPFANRIIVENGEHINVIGIHTHFEGPATSFSEHLEAKEKYFIRFPYFEDNGLAATYHKYKAGGTPHWVVVDKDLIVRESIFGSDPNRALLRLDYIIDELKQK